jgi:hypothetical protein
MSHLASNSRSPPLRSDGLPPGLAHAILMRAGMEGMVEGMVEVVPVVASGAWGQGAVGVGVAAQGAQPMRRERFVCRY